ncbi:unnamed protein product, partial [marine sediment metagenome]
DLFSRGLAKHGWETHDLITNCTSLQNQWARENNYTGDDPIWVEQIRRYEPDVVYAQGIWLVNDDTYPIIKKHCSVIAGQVGSLVVNFELTKYDVIFTMFPAYVDRFKEAGVNARYLPHSFDPLALERIGKRKRDISISFVGQLIDGHSRRKDVLAALNANFDVQQWVSERWGLDMFEVMSRSYMTINCDIDTEFGNGGNMRAYEATGCGALLLTNDGPGVGALFEDDEILKYNSPEEAVELARYYLEHRREGREIAAKGQKRTLANYTYKQRMGYVGGILEELLA